MFEFEYHLILQIIKAKAAWLIQWQKKNNVIGGRTRSLSIYLDPL